MSAGFRNVRELILAEEYFGNRQIVSFHKTPTQTTATGFWFDLSMSPGNPVAQYYAATPLVATAMARSTDGGLNHGGNVTPSKKYLRKATIMTTTSTVVPCPICICDYLLYYPFVDQSVTDPQPLTNSTTLPRYTDGKGVQAMAICVAAQVGGQSFSINYTNSDGVAGRVSPNIMITTQAVNGTVITSATATSSACGIFLPLQAGDSGIRSIESVTMNGVDIGLMALVLVKPIAQLSIRGIDSPVEIDYLKDFTQLLEIKDDAYLNFVVMPSGTVSGSRIMGMLEFVWY
jgi:hypothetical protein